MNLPKETKDLCIENYKTLMKDITDDTNEVSSHAIQNRHHQKLYQQ